MILSVEFNGYRFFNDKSELSFCADARTKKLLSNSVNIDEKNVLKSVGLYGANNSGKTNIIKLFKFIKLTLSGYERIPYNNTLFNDSERVNIIITFNNNDNKGWFKYEYTYNCVKNIYEYECLKKVTFYSGSSNYETIVFEKDNNNRVLNIYNESMLEYLSVIPSRLPLVYSVNIEEGEFSNLKDAYETLCTFGDSIEVVNMYNMPIENTLATMKTNNENKKSFIKAFVKNADLTIDNFEYDPNLEFSLNIDGVNERVLANPNVINDYKFITTYGNTTVPSIFFDSTGTKKIEAVASHIYDSIVNGKTLIIDEIDNGLHYRLTRAIVSLFNNIANKRGQLMFITHDLLLIDCNKLMRKDQIYFVNRDRENAKLHCLKEFTSSEGGPREVNDIIKHYNRGEFGNVPTPDFVSLLLGAVNK